MIDLVLLYLIAASMLGCGLSGGVFFAFSIFIMSGLARLPAAQGVSAMNSINVTAINPLFMLVLFGTGASSLAAAGLALFSGDDPRTPWLCGAAGLYLGGVILVTMAYNVPRNDALAALSAGDAEIAIAWREYLVSWTAWNHVRTIAAVLAVACLVAALPMRGANAS